MVGTFKRCQLCSHTSDDICAFRMWYECKEWRMIEASRNKIVEALRQTEELGERS